MIDPGRNPPNIAIANPLKRKGLDEMQLGPEGGR